MGLFAIPRLKADPTADRTRDNRIWCFARPVAEGAFRLPLTVGFYLPSPLTYWAGNPAPGPFNPARLFAVRAGDFGGVA